MAKSPEIRTARLFITPFLEKYLSPRYVGWLNNPEVTCFSEQRHKEHTIESCRKYLESFENTPNYFWALLEIGNNSLHIGNINAYVDPINEIADIGILIGETSAWRNGYATEAFEAVCGFLLEKQKLRKVTAGAIRPNKQMLKVMQKIGMIEDGIRKRHYIWNNKEVDVIHMAMFRNQWLTQRKGNQGQVV